MGDFTVDEYGIAAFPGFFGQDRDDTSFLNTVNDNNNFVVRSSSWGDHLSLMFYRKQPNTPPRKIGQHCVDYDKICEGFSSDRNHYYVTSGKGLSIYDLSVAPDQANFFSERDLGVVDANVAPLSIYGKDGVVYMVININDDGSSRTVNYRKQYRCNLVVVKFDLDTQTVVSHPLYRSEQFLTRYQSDFGVFIFRFDSNVLRFYNQEDNVLESIDIDSGPIEEFKILTDKTLLVKIDSCFYLYHIDNGCMTTVGSYEYKGYTVAMGRFLIFHNINEIVVVCTLTGIEVLFCRPDDDWHDYIQDLIPFCPDENSLAIIETRNFEYNIEHHTCFNYLDYITDVCSEYTPSCVNWISRRPGSLPVEYSLLYRQAFPLHYLQSPMWHSRRYLVMSLCRVRFICKEETAAEYSASASAAAEAAAVAASAAEAAAMAAVNAAAALDALCLDDDASEQQVFWANYAGRARREVLSQELLLPEEEARVTDPPHYLRLTEKTWKMIVRFM